MINSARRYALITPALWLLAGLIATPFAHAQTADCTYSISNEWSTGYTANIRITNNSAQTINGWNVSWHYQNNQMTNGWNANFTGNNPFQASNLAWNGNITPGTHVEFGFQVNKNGGAAEQPAVEGNICNSNSQQSSVSSQSSYSSSVISVSSVYSSSSSSNSSLSSHQSSQSSGGATAGGFVSEHGHLRASGTQLLNRHNQPVQLRGMSSHGLQWYGEFMNIDSIRWLRDDWGINVIRAAMYTSSDGYISNPSVKYKVFEIVEAAIELDIYVLVDWHILSDGNPQTYQQQAKVFFDEVASRYGNIPNIIYEIANEPNGGGVNWNNAIRPYAQDVIPVIRQHAPDSLVIVGTATWSQDVTDAAANPVTFPNVGYAMHFYACTHGQWLRDKVDQARAQGALIFSTEWGTADATGDGQVCEQQTREWINFLNARGISWVNWSITPKVEGTAALRPGASPTGNWSASDLSPSGTLVKELISE